MASLVTQIPHSEVTATLELLDNYGVTREHLARLRGDSAYAKRVAATLLERNNRNFFGAPEWQVYYNVAVQAVPDFPWGGDVLDSPCPFVGNKLVWETHYAFLGLDSVNGSLLTIMQLHKLHPVKKQPRLYFSERDAWYRVEKFATEVACELRWYLLLKEIVPGSESKKYDEQVALLPPEYEVPAAVVESFKDVAHYRTTGEYPNRSRYARCGDIASGGYRVVVGRFDADGLDVNYYWDDYRYSYMGIAASRKLPGV